MLRPRPAARQRPGPHLHLRVHLLRRLRRNPARRRLPQDRFRDLMAGFCDGEALHAKLAEVERRNLSLYGYGVKGFTLSMIETAMELTGQEPPGRVIAEILAAG